MRAWSEELACIGIARVRNAVAAGATSTSTIDSTTASASACAPAAATAYMQLLLLRGPSHHSLNSFNIFIKLLKLFKQMGNTWCTPAPYAKAASRDSLRHTGEPEVKRLSS